VNFVVCPYDNANLKAERLRHAPGAPLLMRCPACGRRFELVGGEAVEVTSEDPEA
jgi:uncharacterized protein YbaR (Trm112 family)